MSSLFSPRTARLSPLWGLQAAIMKTFVGIAYTEWEGRSGEWLQLYQRCLISNTYFPIKGSISNNFLEQTKTWTCVDLVKIHLKIYGNHYITSTSKYFPLSVVFHLQLQRELWNLVSLLDHKKHMLAARPLLAWKLVRKNSLDVSVSVLYVNRVYKVKLY